MLIWLDKLLLNIDHIKSAVFYDEIAVVMVDHPYPIDPETGIEPGRLALAGRDAAQLLKELRRITITEFKGRYGADTPEGQRIDRNFAGLNQ